MRHDHVFDAPADRPSRLKARLIAGEERARDADGVAAAGEAGGGEDQHPVHHIAGAAADRQQIVRIAARRDAPHRRRFIADPGEGEVGFRAQKEIGGKLIIITAAEADEAAVGALDKGAPVSALKIRKAPAALNARVEACPDEGGRRRRVSRRRRRAPAAWKIGAECGRGARERGENRRKSGGAFDAHDSNSPRRRRTRRLGKVMKSFSLTTTCQLAPMAWRKMGF